MCQNHSHLLARRILRAENTGPTEITITVELAQDLTVHLQTGGKLMLRSSESVSLHFPTGGRPSSSGTATTAVHTTWSPVVGDFVTEPILPPSRRSNGS